MTPTLAQRNNCPEASLLEEVSFTEPIYAGRNLIRKYTLCMRKCLMEHRQMMPVMKMAPSCFSFINMQQEVPKMAGDLY